MLVSTLCAQERWPKKFRARAPFGRCRSAPLALELYSYPFPVDGMRIADQANAALQTGVNGLDASLLDVPGPAVRRGALQARSYVFEGRQSGGHEGQLV